MASELIIHCPRKKSALTCGTEQWDSDKHLMTRRVTISFFKLWVSVKVFFLICSQDAMVVILKSLVPGCLFNIIGFGSTYKSLFTTSQHYEEVTQHVYTLTSVVFHLHTSTFTKTLQHRLKG